MPLALTLNPRPKFTFYGRKDLEMESVGVKTRSKQTNLEVYAGVLRVLMLRDMRTRFGALY